MINHWMEYVGIGMNWALGSGCQIPQAAATYLQSWGERAGAVAVIWLPGAEMLFHHEKCQWHKNIRIAVATIHQRLWPINVGVYIYIRTCIEDIMGRDNMGQRWWLPNLLTIHWYTLADGKHRKSYPLLGQALRWNIEKPHETTDPYI